MSGADEARVVHFLGLTESTETEGGRVVFPLGILYPYTPDLRRVCAAFAALEEADPHAAAVLIMPRSAAALEPPVEQTPELAAFVASIGALHGRIAFAPGPAPDAVRSAFHDATAATTAAHVRP